MMVLDPRHARSWLFTPADRPERFPLRSRPVGAVPDAVILDLEDAVAPGSKDLARDNLLRCGTDLPEVWVRVNDRTGEHWRADLDAAGRLPALAGVVLPKAEHPEDIAATAALLPAGTPVVALVETSLGVENAFAVAREPAVFALAFGVADFRRETGLGDAPEAWAYPRTRLVIASRAAGLRGPLDGPAMQLDDLEAVRAEAARGRAGGFTGKLCIHPAQITPVNAGFDPDPEQLAWARRVLDRADSSEGAAVRVDGEMIDRPRLDLARALLAAQDTGS
ncbi:HpcH/HpaI aldolase/citrate lyase family protein [Streptomyces sp. BE303]|uniref:HpcH/HpaI aldolase/citrate lyase family protein n=1 Tax=Streptomyces sp. BE303 TaxID=3002528 RepID=UPI002E78950B|nr:CoA ester lyase [Streptomyces sp. BE303]MED7948850.1 CoA ester lyase [Streptomyces sp. BE303]